MTNHRPPTLPAGCTGDCDGASRDCTCGRALGMWDDERARPRRALLLYTTVIVLSMLASAVWPWGMA